MVKHHTGHRCWFHWPDWNFLTTHRNTVPNTPIFHCPLVDHTSLQPSTALPLSPPPSLPNQQCNSIKNSLWVLRWGEQSRPNLKSVHASCLPPSAHHWCLLPSFALGQSSAAYWQNLATADSVSGFCYAGPIHLLLFAPPPRPKYTYGFGCYLIRCIALGGCLMITCNCLKFVGSP